MEYTCHWGLRRKGITEKVLKEMMAETFPTLEKT
jgi:hypothetical protein